MKEELEQTVKQRITTETEANRYREQLGERQIQLNELNTRVNSLTIERDGLSQYKREAGDVEKQLADFTKSTEETSAKFEQIIVDQRRKITVYETRIKELEVQYQSQVSEYDAKLKSLSNTLDATQAKQQAASADVSRLRAEQQKKDTEITTHGKELKASVSTYQQNLSLIHI